MPENFIQEIFTQFTVWLVLGISGTIGTSLFAYFRSLKKCQMETKAQVNKLSKRTFRQSQAQLTTAAAIDRLVKKLHEEEGINLLDEVNRQIRDEHGNL